MTQERRLSSQNRPCVSRPGAGGLRFGMFAVCVSRDSDPGLNKGKAKALYPLLVAYADVSTRNTAQGYPYRSALADALDCTKDTIDTATKYLENEIGLIKVDRRKVPGQPDLNDANEYMVFDSWLIHGVTPPKGTPPQLVARYGPTIPGLDVAAWVAEHAPYFDLAGWRAKYEARLAAQEVKRAGQRRKEAVRRKPKKKGNGGGGGTDSATPEGAEGQGGSGTHSATGGGVDSAIGGGTDSALSRACSPETSSTAEAPSGRSPVDGRSPSPTGSTRAREEGDFVASDNDSPLDLPQHDYADGPVGGKSGSNRKARHTRAQLDLVREVRVFFPPELGVPDIPTVSQAVLDALAGDVPFAERTPEQLGARIRQRWVDHGFAAKFYAGEIGKPAGVAVALVRPLKGSDRYGCADPRCEAGVNVDTGEVCVPCSERIAERKAARRQERAQAAANGAGTPSVDSSAAVAPEGPSLPAPRAMVEWWHCANEGCDVTGKVPAPADDVCPTCRDKEALAAEIAEAAFVPRPVPQVDLPPADREPDERTLRLQAKIAARFGTAEQQDLYCEAQQSPAPAPF